MLNPAPETRPPQTAALLTEFEAVRRASIALAAPLEAEDCVVQTIPEVSPTKWHLAHVTWFFEHFCLMGSDQTYEVFDEHYLYLFNSYYHSVGKMHARPRRGLLSRPLLHEVLAYRKHVDAAMARLIEARGDDPDFAFLVTLGLHHEQQHQELLLTDIKHVFFTNPLGPAYAEAVPRKAGIEIDHEFVPGREGRHHIGHAGAGFCFDNETPRHDVLLSAHALGNRLITNREYREFIDAGGYRDSQLWLSDGWARVTSEQWSRPLYWADDLESEFTLSGWQPIDPASPVCHVSHYEADAFARWAGARLPLESEWEVAAAALPVAGNTLDAATLHPRPVSAGDRGQPKQIWGDVWEWTGSPYVPYPRFKPLAGSLGEYNGKFMSNQIVVRGGSCATWAGHLRATYRSFFYPHDRWQFLGIRLAKDV